MDRSVADRSLIGRLARPPRAAPKRSRAPRDRDAGAGRARIAIGLPWPLDGARSLLGGARTALGFLWRHRRARIALLAVLAASPLLAGGWLWLRHSSLVAVQRVRVSGVHGPEANAIRAALAAAGRHMSTLDVNTRALRAAVAPFRVVREVRAVPSFPHGLQIRVLERLPVAALTVNGTRTAVAADGVVLGPALLAGSLPTLDGSYAPGVGQRLAGANVLAPLAVLGATPPPLAKLLTRVYSGPKGLTVVMRSGLLAYFGDASRPHAKWLSLARVMADSSSAGASYVDVRLPERPAAGFPAGVSPPAASASATASPVPQTSATEPTVAALAAGLAANGGVASTSNGEPSGAPAGAGSSAGESAPSGAAEGGAEAPESTTGPSG
jgi:cell division protein FtsQ